MIRFLTANWIWFVLIGAMLLMHRGHAGHGGGGGCGGHGSPAHDRHAPDTAVDRTSAADDGTTTHHSAHPAADDADRSRYAAGNSHSGAR